LLCIRLELDIDIMRLDINVGDCAGNQIQSTIDDVELTGDCGGDTALSLSVGDVREGEVAFSPLRLRSPRASLGASGTFNVVAAADTALLLPLRALLLSALAEEADDDEDVLSSTTTIAGSCAGIALSPSSSSSSSSSLPPPTASPVRSERALIANVPLPLNCFKKFIRFL
jgi:hypothetical protein